MGSTAYGTYAALLSLSFLLSIVLDMGITNQNTRHMAQHTHLMGKTVGGVLGIRSVLVVLYAVLTIGTGLVLGFKAEQMAILGWLAATFWPLTGGGVTSQLPLGHHTDATTVSSQLPLGHQAATCVSDEGVQTPLGQPSTVGAWRGESENVRNARRKARMGAIVERKARIRTRGKIFPSLSPVIYAETLGGKSPGPGVTSP